MEIILEYIIIITLKGNSYRSEGGRQGLGRIIYVKDFAWARALSAPADVKLP